MTKKVAYQGVKASFSEMAIARRFSGEAEAIGKVTFDEVFEALCMAEVDLAALPIENSLIGPIVENLDLLARHEAHVVGELCLPIEHCLVGKKGQKLEEIRKVSSHPKALAQCTRFFQEHPWIEPVVHFDTAGAAKEIAMGSDTTAAAIGSRKTAEEYGLEILQKNLEDDGSNTTRFLFLQKGGKERVDLKEGKCSLLFTLAHEPGSLAAALNVLAEEGLNLMQIVSRPIKEKPFEYLFFVDLLYSDKIDLQGVLEKMAEHTETFKLLGVYEPAQ